MEVMRVAEFINIVGNFNRLQKHEDVLWWKADSRGIFKVGAAYRLMEQPSQQNPTCIETNLEVQIFYSVMLHMAASRGSNSDSG